MRPIRLLIGVASALAVAGCINSTTVIKVKPDGSGIVEQTTLVNLAALKEMMPPGATQTGGMNQVSDDDLRRTAEKMGRGVRLLSSEPVKDGGFEGVKATFAFDDINQVQISQDPPMNGSPSSPTEPGDEPVRFKLTQQDGTSLLTVTIQDKPASNGGQQADMPDMADPAMMGMIKTMFQGFKINIVLDVIGTIVRTNADYVDGSRITLLEMDMSAMLEDQARFKAIQGKLGPNASLSAIKPYLKDLKGIKLDGPVVNVEFR